MRGVILLFVPLELEAIVAVVNQIPVFFDFTPMNSLAFKCMHMIWSVFNIVLIFNNWCRLLFVIIVQVDPLPFLQRVWCLSDLLWWCILLESSVHRKCLSRNAIRDVHMNASCVHQIRMTCVKLSIAIRVLLIVF